MATLTPAPPAARPAAVTVDVGALAPEDVVAVARDGAPVVLSEAALTAIDRGSLGGRGARGGAHAGVRHLDRVRRSGHPAHPDRDAGAAAAVAGPLACRGLRS